MEVNANFVYNITYEGIDYEVNGVAEAIAYTSCNPNEFEIIETKGFICYDIWNIEEDKQEYYLEYDNAFRKIIYNLIEDDDRLEWS